MTQFGMSYPAVYDPPSQFSGKNSNKRDLKAQELLMGIIDLYVQNGKPVGSQTLKSEGFAHLSSATIRNYFAWLDKEGFLEQVHTSGGRIPTDLAWRRYFDQCTSEPISSSLLRELEILLSIDDKVSKTQALYDRLSTINDNLARWSRCATFLATPVFEQDNLTHIKIWPFQIDRWVVLMRSQMGFFRHELISLDIPTQHVRVNYIEQCLEQKIRDPLAQFDNLDEQEQKILHELYSELMVRQLVQHSQPYERIWLRSGLSYLLNYPELAHAEQLAQALHFFEHRRSKEKLLQFMHSSPTTRAWIGKEMHQLFSPSSECSLLACPFFIHQQMAGLIGLVGPRRIPYTKLRHALEYASRLISHYLTREYYVFKLAYEPKPNSPPAKQKEEMKR